MQKNILITLGAILILGGAGYGYYKWQAGSSVSSTTNATSTTTTNSEFPISASSSAPIKIKPLPVPSTSGLPPHPVINRPFTIPTNFSAEETAILKSDIAQIRAVLQKDPEDLNAWIELGLRYKAINDYQGALESWEYVSLMSPTNIVSYNNLGNLYHYELRDYVRAEMSFLQAIKNDPHYILSYANLYDLYRLSYKKDTNKAEDILQQGIKQNPKAIDLVVALATYYRDKGNVADAKTYYQRAITLATEVNNANLVQSLKAELQALE